MSRPRNVVHVIERAYLDELRRRIETGPGVVAIAREAGLSRVTVWGTLSTGSGRPRAVTVDAISRIRDALHLLDPAGAPLPPPVVGVRDPAHHAWIQLADELTPDEVAALAADRPGTLAVLRTALAAAAARKPRRR